ncbi:MAG: hypothetical protein DPW18_05185 [Chloroflexi bacterium]|nr:hypothetical protein [Chloroflexota bacterium]MDL1910031.1 hypothetical protein [Chloroflexi bacterium CFX6]
MKDGKCPRCKSDTVYMKRRGLGHGSSGLYIYISKEFATRPTHDVDHYICTTCGYFESYIEDKARLEAVAKDWKKVG